MSLQGKWRVCGRASYYFALCLVASGVYGWSSWTLRKLSLTVLVSAVAAVLATAVHRDREDDACVVKR